MARSYVIRTYGCQMNERDSEAVAALLESRGYRMVDAEAHAEIVLLNTCSVRNQAEQKALGKMGLLAHGKHERPDRILGFLGCMAQARGRDLLRRLPDVDLVVGTHRFHRVAALLDEVRAGRRGIVDVADDRGRPPELSGHRPARGRTTAFVSIMRGCDQFCTFCIVPHTRGREQSRPAPEIVEEVRGLCREGVREVTLLGQIVTSYGRREAGMTPRRGSGGGTTPFVRLLEALHEVDGLDRIRFTAPHPGGVGEDLIRALRDLPRVCEQLHLPLQSGSNRVLDRMRRGHTVEAYLDLVDRVRAAVPGVALSTDLIAGFPGETIDDHEQTLTLVERVGFDHAFVFKYSPRDGTPAARMDDPVAAAECARRHRQLLEAVDRSGAARLAALVGTTQEILVEGRSKRNPHRAAGRTRGNHLAAMDGDGTWTGRLVRVGIVRASEQTLYARPLQDAAAAAAREPKEGA